MNDQSLVSYGDSNNRMLIIVDPQIDFITGSLSISGAEEAMNALAAYIQKCGHSYEAIIVTCDRHPLLHCSFLENGGNWPRHCVVSSIGAAIWPSLMTSLLPYSSKLEILHKGENDQREEYSIFQSEVGVNAIASIIRDRKIKEVDICGLAGDVCVANTLTDLQDLYPSLHINLLKEFTAYISQNQ